MAAKPHPAPFSLSVAPAPVMEEKEILSLLPDGPISRARLLAWKAWFVPEPERYEMAAEALAIDPHCSDAMLILAELEHEWHPRQNKFERAVSSSSYHSSREGWIETDEKGHHHIRLWVGGPLLRAQIAAARSMVFGGLHWEGMERLRAVITFCPDEPYRLGFELLQLAHQVRDLQTISWTLDFYNGGCCTLAYERLWFALASGAPAADVVAAAKVAESINQHVLPLLRQPPKPEPAPTPYAHLLSRFARNAPQIGNLPPKRFTVGTQDSEAQAQAYVDWTRGYWQIEERAQRWLHSGKLEEEVVAK